MTPLNDRGQGTRPPQELYRAPTFIGRIATTGMPVQYNAPERLPAPGEMQDRRGRLRSIVDRLAAAREVDPQSDEYRRGVEMTSAAIARHPERRLDYLRTLVDAGIDLGRARPAVRAVVNDLLALTQGQRDRDLSREVETVARERGIPADTPREQFVARLQAQIASAPFAAPGLVPAVPHILGELQGVRQGPQGEQRARDLSARIERLRAQPDSAAAESDYDRVMRGITHAARAPENRGRIAAFLANAEPTVGADLWRRLNPDEPTARALGGLIGNARSYEGGGFVHVAPEILQSVNRAFDRPASELNGYERETQMSARLAAVARWREPGMHDLAADSTFAFGTGPGSLAQLERDHAAATHRDGHSTHAYFERGRPFARDEVLKRLEAISPELAERNRLAAPRPDAALLRDRDQMEQALKAIEAGRDVSPELAARARALRERHPYIAPPAPEPAPAAVVAPVARPRQADVPAAFAGIRVGGHDNGLQHIAQASPAILRELGRGACKPVTARMITLAGGAVPDGVQSGQRNRVFPADPRGPGMVVDGPLLRRLMERLQTSGVFTGVRSSQPASPNGHVIAIGGYQFIEAPRGPTTFDHRARPAPAANVRAALTEAAGDWNRLLPALERHGVRLRFTTVDPGTSQPQGAHSYFDVEPSGRVWRPKIPGMGGVSGGAYNIRYFGLPGE